MFMFMSFGVPMSIDQAWLTVREIEKEKFKFIVIDRPEKWEAAKDFKHDFLMKIPGTDETFSIPMTGLSYDQLTDVIVKFPFPEWDEDDGVMPATVVAARERTTVQRRIAILETALGMMIPGSTFEQKRDSLNKTNTGNLDVLEAFARGQLSNLEGTPGLELMNYNQMRQRFPQENVIDVKSFEDFLDRSNSVVHFFRMNRYQQDYIVEFPLKSLTQENKEEIEKRTPEPEPPIMPVHHQVTGRILPGKTRVNTEDPTYIRALNKAKKMRTVMYLNACLPFRLPGESEEDQVAWLGGRLAGDVRQINTYINDVILGVDGRYNLFTNV